MHLETHNQNTADINTIASWQEDKGAKEGKKGSKWGVLAGDGLFFSDQSGFLAEWKDLGRTVQYWWGPGPPTLPLNPSHMTYTCYISILV